MKELKELPAAYKLGVGTIDKQHARIIAILEDTINLKFTRSSSRENSINDIILELIKYSNSHLTYEENLMKKMEYEGLESHLKAHQMFREKVRHLQAKANCFTDENIKELALFLKNWFLDHINRIDRQYLVTFHMYLETLDNKEKFD